MMLVNPKEVKELYNWYVGVAAEEPEDALDKALAEAATVEVPKPARWIPVEECLPETIACAAGTAYSEAVIVWTTGKKAMIAVWDGEDFIAPVDFWEAEGEYITHWIPLPTPPKEAPGNG
jgi:hypothetical protein